MLPVTHVCVISDEETRNQRVFLFSQKLSCSLLAASVDGAIKKLTEFYWAIERTYSSINAKKY